MNATYSIPECNLPELEARIAKLNKRAAKLGVPEIAVTKTEGLLKAKVRVLTVNMEINKVWMDPAEIEEANKKWPHTDTGERMRWWDVTVDGAAPTLTDWEFVAVLEPMATDDGATLNLLRCLPGKTCPNEYRDRIGACDHCKTHRNRKETFVVRHETTGDHKCVGRSCLKDFLNYHKDPHNLASWAEHLAGLASMMEEAGDDEWLGGGGGWRERSWDLKLFLGWTIGRINAFGWLSKGRAYEMGRDDATANVVLKILTPPMGPYITKKEHEAHDALCDACAWGDKEAAEADAAIDWARDLPAAELEKSDYLYNINLVARVGVASRKTAGLAASIIPAYRKHVEAELKKVEFAKRPESNWVGEVGKRIDMIEVTCEKIIRSENDWGVSGIHKMVDASGNVLTWFASASAAWLKEGEKATVAATVTKHSEFKGRKETVVNRVTIWTDEGLAAHKAKMEKKAARTAKKAAKTSN